MRRSVVGRWFWLVVAGAPLLFACSRLRMTQECRKLSAVVETGRIELERVTRPKTPAAFRTASPLYRKLAERLRLSVASRQLRATAEEYARSVEGIATTLGAYADALEANDPVRVKAVRVEVDRASRRERLASRRLEDQCHGRF
jgi:hypothetical protein